ncbi:phage antirepressor [Fischerella thermalis CCMEE 5273]|nr:phage antirepressor [Fischerella thermalis CCMEE 5273]
MSNLTVFEFESKEIRFVGTSDDPWWVAADVCAVLEIKNVGNVIAKLDEDEKRDDIQIMDVIGRSQSVWCINESGLYSLILTSRKPQAKRFKKWVTSVVLPSIRKTGSYAIAPTPPTPQEISELYDLTLGSAGLDPKLVAGVKLNAIAEYHPALKSAAEIAKPTLQIEVESQLLSPTQLGHILSESLRHTFGERTQHTWTPRQVNKLLIEQGFQYRNPDGNSPAYLPTEKGRQYCKVILNTAQGRDKTVQSLRWFKEVLEAIQV